MKKMSQQTIHKISVPILVVVILLLLFFLVMPVREDILILKEETTDARVDLEKQFLNGQLLRETQTQFESVKPRLPHLEATVLKRGQELFLITTLEQLATNHGLIQKLNMDDLTFPKDTEITDVVPLPIRVELTGNYQQILGFLSEAELLEFYINWHNVNIKSLASPDISKQTRPLPGLAPIVTPVPEDIEASVRVVLTGETYWQIQ